MANSNSSYVAKRASNLTNPTAATVFLQVDKTTHPAYVLFEPAATGITSARFVIRARGRVTTGGAITFLSTIQYVSDISTDAKRVTAATATNNTDFFALSARTPSTTTRYWEAVANVMWDSTSQRLTGTGNGFNNETIETANGAITALTAVDLTTGKVGFVVSCIFGSSNASNVATLDEFYLEAV